MLELEAKLVVRQNKLFGNIRLRSCANGGYDFSETFVIENSVAIVFRCFYPYNSSKHGTLIFLSFYKIDDEDKNSYRLKFKSMALDISERFFTTDDKGTWHNIFSLNRCLSAFDVNATVEVIKYQKQNTIPTLLAIHDDTELTDFELVGTDGTVRVHRAVLAVASPVLRRMLSGEWREAASGRVELPDTTRETLQHLKDFVYLGALPESGLRPLLLLAACYMMPELEDRCVQVLADGVTSETIYELLEFAYGNKVTKLVKRILERVEWGKAKVPQLNIRSKPRPRDDYTVHNDHDGVGVYTP